MAKRKAVRAVEPEPVLEPTSDFELEEVESTPIFTMEVSLVVLTTMFLIGALVLLWMALEKYYASGPLA